MPSILIIDDEPNIRRMVGALLHAEGYDVREAATGQAAVMMVQDEEPDAALLDLMMPGELDGLATLARIRERWSDLPIVMMSGRASLGDAVRATKLGAVNFLEKPLSPETVLLALSSALELRQTRRAARALREELGLTGEMVGSSAAIARVRDIIQRVAPSDARVLISGESGTGKELVAVAIHDKSPRRGRPFVRVNCAAIPRDLVESEMFGHEKGAFTGATAARAGRFELAHTGTLFLDEVGDLTLEAQAKLLRAIEAREIQRVGGNRTIRVDVRVIAATNKDLAHAVTRGDFREDLFFRLNVIPIALPPLRERGEDVVQLVAHCSAVQRQRTGRVLRWSDEALDAIRAYAWPGNVRELANLVERIAIMSDGSLVLGSDVSSILPHPRGGAASAPAFAPTSSIASASVPDPVSPHTPSAAPPRDAGLVELLDATERQLITDALARASGNVAEAARRLHTDRPNLYRRMKRLGITGAAAAALAAALGAVALAPAFGTTLQAQQTHRALRTDATVTNDTVPADADGTPLLLHGRLGIASGKAYNRVEGFPILIGPEATLQSDAVTADASVDAIIHTAPGIRFTAPDMGYDAHATVRVGPDHRIALGVEGYDVVTPVEPWQMTEPEAGLAAVLLHRDYLDYYGRHGAEASASWTVSDAAHVTLGYADERWRSLPARDPWSLFRNGDPWRDNPAMDEGRFHRFTADAVLDTRNDASDPSGGWYLHGTYELGSSPHVLQAPRTPSDTATPPPAARVHYGRVFVDLRRYNRISPRTQVDARIVFGGWVQGDPLPLERRVSVGGPGTLPGYDFRAPSRGSDVETCTTGETGPNTPPALCDRVALGQLEVRTDLLGGMLGTERRAIALPILGLATQMVGVAFVDVGRGWRTTQPWPSAYKSDIGTGVDFGLVSVYAAKALTDWGTPVHLLVRVRRRF